MEQKQCICICVGVSKVHTGMGREKNNVTQLKGKKSKESVDVEK